MKNKLCKNSCMLAVCAAGLCLLNGTGKKKIDKTAYKWLMAGEAVSSVTVYKNIACLKANEMLLRTNETKKKFAQTFRLLRQRALTIRDPPMPTSLHGSRTDMYCVYISNNQQVTDLELFYFSKSMKRSSFSEMLSTMSETFSNTFHLIRFRRLFSSL